MVFFAMILLDEIACVKAVIIFSVCMDTVMIMQYARRLVAWSNE